MPATPIRTTYYDIYIDPQGRGVRLVRTPVPFADVSVVGSLGDEVGPLLRRAAKPGVRLLLDFRHGPPGRNDPEFEAAVERSRAVLSELYEVVGVLVASAAGRLQVQRIARVNHRPTEVFLDEAEALRWLEHK